MRVAGQVPRPHVLIEERGIASPPTWLPRDVPANAPYPLLIKARHGFAHSALLVTAAGAPEPGSRTRPPPTHAARMSGRSAALSQAQGQTPPEDPRARATAGGDDCPPTTGRTRRALSACYADALAFPPSFAFLADFRPFRSPKLGGLSFRHVSRVSTRLAASSVVAVADAPHSNVIDVMYLSCRLSASGFCADASVTCEHSGSGLAPLVRAAVGPA